MKRSFDIIKRILAYIEASESPVITELPPIEGIDKLAWDYNLGLLLQKKYIFFQEDLPKDKNGKIERVILGLTWEGHELLDMLKDDKITKKVLNGLSKKLTGVPFDVFQMGYRTVTKNLCTSLFDDEFSGED